VAAGAFCFFGFVSTVSVGVVTLAGVPSVAVEKLVVWVSAFNASVSSFVYFVV
jgi:hypothetical protein